MDYSIKGAITSGLLFIITLFYLGACTQMSTSAPTLSPPPSKNVGKIAFSSNRDGNPEIYVMNEDGSNLTRLTNNASNDWHPAWSPDGTKIAFDSDRDGDPEIYVMDVDGGIQTRVTNSPGGDFFPVRSPATSNLFDYTTWRSV